jgi:L-threonylcarbamoyladenylate synthase
MSRGALGGPRLCVGLIQLGLFHPSASLYNLDMSIEQAPRILPPDGPAYAAASELLRAGGLVAFPTETVYGLGADATNDQAVAGIFAAKDRPRFNPLIVHLLDAEHADAQACLDARAWQLAEAFWPGPLTLVLRRRRDCCISLLCSAGLETLALRVPRHPVARTLLKTCDLPLAAPSANAAGRISPTTAGHVAASLGPRVPLILDGGPCPIGIESTVLDVSEEPARLLRPGTITREQIEAVIGPIEVGTEGGDKRSPGLLASHYAPRHALRLQAERVAGDEGLVAFGPQPLSGAAKTLNLSPTGDLTEAAAHLFAALHELDQAEVACIAVMPIPDEGLGTAINDRLERAAAPSREVDA